MPSQHLVCPEVAISRRIHLREGKSTSNRPCEKFQRFTGSLWAGTLNLGGVMREGRCCDRGNFPRTRLSGSRLSWPKLAKARSGLVPMFQRREKKLAVSELYNSPRLLDVAQEFRLSQSGMLCCNPSWHAGNWSRQRTDRGVGTSGWSLEWVASVEVCRRWRSYNLRRLRATTQSLIDLETDRPVTIPTARGQTWQGRDSLDTHDSQRTSLSKVWSISGRISSQNAAFPNAPPGWLMV